MSVNNKEFKVALESVSSYIENLLSKEDDNEEELIFAEKWLSTHLNKIRVKTLEHLQMSGSQDTDSKLRKDGMFIINSSTEIIRNPGFQNYFADFVNYAEKLRLSDMIEEESQHDFQTVFLEALSERKNAKVEVIIKTGTNKKNKCLLEIDISSSNLENNRIIIYYSFSDFLNIQSFDFRSIVLDNLPGMDVFLFDREYRYILAGGKEKEKNNLVNSDFIGKQLFEVYDKQVQRRFFPFYNKAINGEFTEGEIRYSKDVYYVAAAPVKNDAGETVAGILISQNVTKDKQLEENLIKSKEQAQQANKAKSIFLANMSHEIRTPLNSIIGFAGELHKTPLNEQQQKFVSLINNSSEHLLYLVNEIVFLFKLGMDKVYIEKTTFSVKELLREIYDVYKKQAADKGLEFIMETDNEIPDTLKGDPFRLRQILMNLLVNALKYTDKGQVKMTTKVRKQTSKSVEMLFEVSDTGIGINKKDLPYIFDLFEQGNKRTEKIRGGAGLGLGICKKLVTLFKGEITVKSQINKGSKFSVSIPMELSSADQIEEKEREYSLDDKLLRGKRILLADDDDHNLLLAEMILKGWETNHVLVKDGTEAIKQLKEEKFDLVLLDIHMPRKNGVEVIKKIRSLKGINFYTPFVALTANALKADINSYLKAGFNDYVIKPFYEVDLYNKICNILQLEDSQITIESTNKKNMEETIPTDSFNVEELIKTAGEDNQFYNMMIDNFITNALVLIDNFKDAMEKKDWNELGEKAHKAIPSFRFFKLKDIAEELMNIENQALRDQKYHNLPETVNQVSLKIQESILQAKSAKI